MNENPSIVDVVAHPVRLRLLSELVGRTATTRELARALTDVPQATLYRHVAALIDAGVLQVAPCSGDDRGERHLSIASGMDRIDRASISTATPSQHRGFFATFVASLADTLGAALATSSVADLLDAGLAYNRVVVHLSDEEREHYAGRLSELVGEMVALEPSPERRPHTLASVVIPRLERAQP